MAKRRTQADPHAAREAQLYENPIPSREFILETLSQVDAGMSMSAVATSIGIKGEAEQEGLRRRIKAMLRDGQIVEGRKGKYRALTGADAMQGKVLGHRDGFGFVSVEGEDNDIYLANRQMQQVFDGDVVKVEVTGQDQRGRREGVVVEVVERNTKQLVGKLINHRGKLHLEAENTRIKNWVMIEDGSKVAAAEGDYVMVLITQQPSFRQTATGQIIDVIGDRDTVGVATELALRAHDIPFEWPGAVEDEARKFGDAPAAADKKNRVDLRELPLVTIDGEDARDFDDAVYCEPKKSGGWRLWVAIADVSHYVQVGSALDVEAHKRGTSVYFPDRVVPMLPEALSNGLCSLKPEVDRLCMVCEMTISAAGKLSGYVFYEGLMRSHARLTYNEVGAMLEVEGADPACNSGQYQDFVPQLRDMHNLYLALRDARAERGAIDFETVETRIVFDEKKRIEAIVPVHRHDAHRLIEECMLCANVATAKALEKAEVEALYRVHNGPTEQKLTNLREFLGEIGLGLRGGEEPTPKDYQNLLASIGERTDASLIQTMLLRSLSQAVYQPENDGHFGLHYKGYTHFTSPIRRYPDLLVHRALRYLVRNNTERKGLSGVGHKLRSMVGGGGANKHFKAVPGAAKLSRKKIYPYDMAALQSLGEHCSTVERRADDASRDVMAFLKCEFLQEHVGNEHPGVIAAVTGFGLFVELQDLYIEGLVHISELPQDYYQYDQAHQRLIGERTRRSFQLGDAVQVQVARVDLDQRKIDLRMAGTDSPKKNKGSVRDSLAKGDIPSAKKKPSSKSGRKRRGPKGAAGKPPGKGPSSSAKKPRRK